MTTALNAIALPFTLRLPSDPDDYQRYEAAQLWFDRSHLDQVYPVVQTGYQCYADAFSDGLPLLMQPLAKGLAIAPFFSFQAFGAEEFGHHIIRLITESLLEAQQMGDETLENRWRLLQTKLAAES